MYSATKEKFIRRFGDKEAEAMEVAAFEHNNQAHSNAGKDAFKWAILICIGYQCFEKYGEYHGFKASFKDIKAWIREHADLGTHDGDCDYLALMAGKYQGFIKE